MNLQQMTPAALELREDPTVGAFPERPDSPRCTQNTDTDAQISRSSNSACALPLPSLGF